MWTKQDLYRSRKMTCTLIEMAENGLIDWETLACDALGWMSEADVAEFARRNDYITNDEDDEEDVDCYEQERTSKYR